MDSLISFLGIKQPELVADYSLLHSTDPKENYDMSASVFVVQFNGFMSLTS